MSSQQRRLSADASTLGPSRAELPDDPRLMEAVKEYLQQLETGHIPSRQEILRRYPDLAGPLAQCLDGLDLVHNTTTRAEPRQAANAVDPLLANPLGDFRILREIGRGGMGVVYEAMQLSLGRRVALKVLPFAAAFDEKHRQRFVNEAQAAALLHHTNIVPVYFVGCERGTHFYAMQLIEGQTLAELIRQLRRQDGNARPDALSRVIGAQTAMNGADLAGMVNPDDAEETPLGLALTTQRTKNNADFFRAIARIILQAAEGLEHAHQYGIVHRDIKPANLLVDAHGRLWITDFGLAQFHAEVGLTKTGDVFGTLRYMSPEQASGQHVVLDHRTDVYSLGATLYELATMEPIFDGQNQQVLLQKILHDEPRAPRAVAPKVPVELETIILKAVSKNPVDRYLTAREFADDLQRYLDDKPIQAKRPGIVERVRKWARRHPSFVGAAALVLLLGTIGLGISTALVTQSLERETKRAEEAEQRFRLARRSANEMIQLAETELADNPGMQNLRRQLLEMALAYFQELIELRRDDPDAQADLAVTRDQVKKILNDLAVLQGAGHLFLLKNADVLDDLGLHGEERMRVNEFVTQMDKQHQESFREFHRLPAEERQNRFVEMARANEMALGELLTPKDQDRLRQIALQAQGPMAFRDVSIVAALKLTQDQRKQMRAIDANVFFEKRDFDRPGGPPKGPPKKGKDEKKGKEDKRTQVMAQMVAVLTAEQAKQWRAMTGEPFNGHLPMFLLGPAPPGGFGGPPPLGFGGRPKKDFGK